MSGIQRMSVNSFPHHRVALHRLVSKITEYDSMARIVEAETERYFAMEEDVDPQLQQNFGINFQRADIIDQIVDTLRCAEYGSLGEINEASNYVGLATQRITDFLVFVRYAIHQRRMNTAPATR